MISKGASDEEDAVGFNVCNIDTVHKVVSMFEQLDP
jgi:hypothetical protein